MGGKIHKKKPKGLKPRGPKPRFSPSSASAAVPASPQLFVFDRERTAHHWWAPLSPATSPDTIETAVKENWRMDPRVEEGRERAGLAADCFRDCPASYAAWKLQVEDYYKDQCWQAFGDATNGRNRVRRGPAAAEELVHVVSLGRLIGFLLKNRRKNDFLKAWVKSFPALRTRLPWLGATDYDDQVWEVAREVNGLGIAEVRRLAGLLADQLGPKEPPWWAGFAAELRGFFDDEDWSGLCRVLGLGKLKAGETLLVFRYRVSEVHLAGGSLYRPTAFEAACDPHHFPSPSSALYGFTMPLEISAAAFCREVIHPPLKGVVAGQACAFPLVRLASGVFDDYAHLPDLRAQQRLRLEKECTEPENLAWLKRHQPGPAP